jgi:hypothetical protein
MNPRKKERERGERRGRRETGSWVNGRSRWFRERSLRRG